MSKSIVRRCAALLCLGLLCSGPVAASDEAPPLMLSWTWQFDRPVPKADIPQQAPALRINQTIQLWAPTLAAAALIYGIVRTTR